MKTAPTPITILIADDHPIFRKGLRDVLEPEADLVVVAEASDGEEALDAIRRHQPRIAILDIKMPRMNGLEVARAVSKEFTHTGTIILTNYDEEEFFNRAMDCGVTGYILKDSATIDLIHGIRQVAEGRYFISPAFAMRLAAVNRPADPAREHRLGLDMLSSTERRVLRLIAESKSTREIASEMYLSPRTVEHHRFNICSKLNLSGSFSLLKFAIEHRGRI